MKFVNWVNKVWTHPRDNHGDYGFRSLMHIPIGFILSIPLLGWFCWFVFYAYEESEDKHCVDEAWKDYNGAMIGASIGAIGWTIVILNYVL